MHEQLPAPNQGIEAERALLPGLLKALMRSGGTGVHGIVCCFYHERCSVRSYRDCLNRIYIYISSMSLIKAFSARKLCGSSSTELLDFRFPPLPRLLYPVMHMYAALELVYGIYRYTCSFPTSFTFPSRDGSFSGARFW
jgi:hypothetical protein